MSTQDGAAHLPLLCRDQQGAHGFCWENKGVILWEKQIMHVIAWDVFLHMAQTSGFVI